MELKARILPIKLLACDVDGVLTDGNIVYGSGSQEFKAFNIQDGLGIKLAGWNGLPVVWITGRSSDAVERRAAELDVKIFQGAKDKEVGIRTAAEVFGVPLEEIAYVSDDLNDLPALKLVGLPIAVANAAPEVKALAAYVTEARGGTGAVREAIELILRGQGRWEAAIETYLSRLHVARVGQ
jgi:3-deoxy-D-manno-octulosonate 8-phosphate phosphatase (KDO 8-P phosphatase)